MLFQLTGRKIGKGGSCRDSIESAFPSVSRIERDERKLILGVGLFDSVPRTIENGFGDIAESISSLSVSA